MDAQPVRVEMLSPEGALSVVLARDAVRFAEQGYTLVGGHAGGPRTDELLDETIVAPATATPAVSLPRRKRIGVPFGPAPA